MPYVPSDEERDALLGEMQTPQFRAEIHAIKVLRKVFPKDEWPVGSIPHREDVPIYDAIDRLEALVRAAEEATAGLSFAVAHAHEGSRLRQKFEKEYEGLHAALRAVKGEQT